MDFSLYTESGGSTAKYNAQRALAGRTHYVDDDSLRFHKSRILQTYIVDEGLLFALIESVGLDWNNTRRGYRYVVFDVFGHVVSRVDLEDCFKTREQARKAMWAYLDTIDAKALTRQAADRVLDSFVQRMRDLLKKLDTL